MAGASLLQRARAVWQLAKNESASAGQIGWAVGVGVFCGCTPAVGFHGWVAVGAATLLRLNRLWAWIGSRVSNVLVLPFIVLAEIESAHWLRTGETVTVDRRHVLGEAHLLLVDWCLGALLVGGALGALFGVLAWAGSRLKNRRARRPRPASESPP